MEELQIKSDLASHDTSDYEGLAALATRSAELSAKREELEALWLAESENGA